MAAHMLPCYRCRLTGAHTKQEWSRVFSFPFKKQIILKTELEKEKKKTQEKQNKQKTPHFFFFSPGVCALNSKTKRTLNISGLIQQPLSQQEHHRCLQEALEWALRATDLQQHGCVCTGSRQFRTGFMKRLTSKKKKPKKGAKKSTLV